VIEAPALALLAASAAVGRAVHRPWPLRLIELVSAYLPLLLMSLLALGTWWLVKNTPLPDGARVEVPARHEPDYTMTRFTVQRFTAEGTLRAQLEGDEMRHYPDTDTLEVDNVRVRSIAPNGRVTLATAQRALGNGDATEVQLLGGAHVTREAVAGEDAIEFRGEFLHVFLATERVRSHLPVTVTRGATVVRGEGLEYDNLAGLLQLKGRVRATFAVPKK
jgi:lipopolysaccharide export system protein LptC